MTAQLIGPRLKALREERGLNQEAVIPILNVGSRQIVSQIETGERAVSGEELLRLSQGFDVSMDYFTDPYRLEGESEFSWRQTGLTLAQLKAYESMAGSWIAMHRYDAPRVGKPAPIRRPKLPLTKASTYEDAAREGERVASELRLGDVPASRLAEAMEQELGVLCLYVDATPGISGAACRLPDLDAVLVNRMEVLGRRNFDLAHELFHIMTWEEMPPEYSEDAYGGVGKNRIEQLADQFASALLMPRIAIDRFGDWNGLSSSELVKRLNEVADKLQVTAQALKWRLVTLGRLARRVALEVLDALLANNGRPQIQGKLPPLFSRRFMQVLGESLNQGLVSKRRAAKLLQVDLDTLRQLFMDHKVPAPEAL